MLQRTSNATSDLPGAVGEMDETFPEPSTLTEHFRRVRFQLEQRQKFEFFSESFTTRRDLFLVDSRLRHADTSREK